MSKKITAKILRVKRAAGFISLRCSVVHYFRDYAGQPRHQILVSFPTFRTSDLGDNDKRRVFWSQVDSELNKLLARSYSLGDVTRIRDRFAKEIPLPATSKLAVVAAPKISTAAAPNISLTELSKRYPLIRD